MDIMGIYCENYVGFSLMGRTRMSVGFSLAISPVENIQNIRGVLEMSVHSNKYIAYQEEKMMS